MRACVRKKISLRRYRRPISRNGTLSFFSPPFANLAENSRRIEDRRNRVRERILEDNCLLFIPFGTVWLSQFALPVSRMYRTLASSILSLSLSLSSSLRRILSWLFSSPTIRLPDFAGAIRIQPIQALCFLFEHLAVIKRFRPREKGEKRNRSKLFSFSLSL